MKYMLSQLIPLNIQKNSVATIKIHEIKQYQCSLEIFHLLLDMALSIFCQILYREWSNSAK